LEIQWSFQGSAQIDVKISFKQFAPVRVDDGVPAVRLQKFTLSDPLKGSETRKIGGYAASSSGVACMPGYHCDKPGRNDFSLPVALAIIRNKGAIVVLAWSSNANGICNGLYPPKHER
jgi:hypothetical protein